MKTKTLSTIYYSCMLRRSTGRIYVSSWRSCHGRPKSFDVDLVAENYAQRTEWAAANFGNTGEPFRMVLPPPNVTGKLHLGHALTVTIEDALCRQHRIKGGVAHWLPGFDHAGIATQSVVERELWKERKITRHDIGRDEFIEYCRQWSEKNAMTIAQQLNRLGATLDWKNSYYTLDKRFSSAVTRAFRQLHSEGLIFRDKRLINWCPHLQSSISDQEVDRVDVPSNSTLSIPSPDGGKRSVRVGVMYRVKYALEDDSSYLEVGTTRPETMFADVALAVHPSDDRYMKYIGKRVRHPLDKKRLIRIIADEAVLKDKGTGVLKITPAHDQLDRQIAERHWDEILSSDSSAKERNCIDEKGRIIAEGFDKMDRFEARRKVIEQLSIESAYGGEMKYEGGQLNVCSRTGDIIEPRLTEQWFLDTRDMHSEAEKAIRDGRISIIPRYHEQALFDWLSNEEPWCLSRQLLWGHRIPAYRTGRHNWKVAGSLEEAALLLGAPVDAIQQDEDVLDTWFSSALVPLVSAGWMEDNFDAKRPPLNIMETGWDIMGFWVARMIMLTMRLSGCQVPFPQVVLHGLLRDPAGRKMSKSLGNVIDPTDILDGIGKDQMMERIKQSSLGDKEIETAISDCENRYPNGIPKSGADALRFALLRHDLIATDVPLNVADLVGEGSRFCNKLWNLIAYMEEVSDKSPSMKDVDSDDITDAWIISRLAATLKQVDGHMTERAPHMAFAVLHKFILANLCDVYLETTKKALWAGDRRRTAEIRSTLQRVVQPTLVQLSVFMPFVSEYLYERVFGREPGSIYFDFVKPTFFYLHRNEELEQRMNLALAVASSVRSVRQQLQLPTKILFEGKLLTDSTDDEIMTIAPVLSNLVDLSLLNVSPFNSEYPEGFMSCTVPGHEAKLLLKIEKSHSVEFISRLERLLEKSVDRQKQFELKAMKYEDIVKRDSMDEKIKKSTLMKNEQKAKQARVTAENARAEAIRIRALIDEQIGRKGAQTKTVETESS